MSPTENTTSSGFDGRRSVFSGLESPREDLDVRARQQAAVLAFGRRSNARPHLAVLMHDAVELVAEILEAEYSGVAQVTAHGANLVLKVTATGAAGQAGPARVHESPLANAAEQGEDSMAAYALNIASPVVTADLVAEERFADHFLRGLGIRGALTIPLHLNTAPFGALGVYTRQQRAFTADDLQFAETIAHLLVSSIARVKAEEALQEQQAFTSTVLGMVDGPVITLDVHGNLLSINRACEQITGFAPAQVRGKPFCSVFATPQEVELCELMFRRAIDGKTACRFESDLLGKDGARRRVAWSAQAICSKDNFVQSLVLSGVDRTEARQPFQKRGEKTGQERRSSPRRTFQYRQWIAPLIGTAMPQRSDFVQVVCDDISAGGISFYLDHPPTFERLLVALGKAPGLTYFAAQVVRIVEKSVRGEKVYLVGCRFTGRAHP